MMKFLQINLNHCKVAQDLLRQRASEEKVDVALVSDPHVVPKDDRSWLACCGTRKAAIWLASGEATVTEVHRDPEFVSARLNEVYVISCYASPNRTAAEFSDFLQRVGDHVRTIGPGVPVIVAGDLNARSAVWGDWCQDSRGSDLNSLFDSLGLVVLNEGSSPTFVGRGRGSIVDVTAASEGIVGRIQGWRVCDEAESGSDHQYIQFAMLAARSREDQAQAGSRGWRTDKGLNVRDVEVGLLIARWTNASGVCSEVAGADQRAKTFEKLVTAACDYALERKAPLRPGKPPAHWWNAEIAGLRKACVGARRRATRSNTRLRRAYNRVGAGVSIADVVSVVEEAEMASRAYKVARKALRSAIIRSKAACWRQLISLVDEDVWGKPYKLVTHKLQGPPATSNMTIESVTNITDVLFPTRPSLVARIHPAGEEFPPITIEEVNRAVNKAQRKSTAPGVDNITGRILSSVHRACPSMLTELYNRCTEEGSVPAGWKRARVVLLKKAGKPDGEPSSYRPICLLNVVGKVFEAILAGRLEEHIESRGGLSPNQYGFIKGKSSNDAVLKLQQEILSAINFPSDKFCLAISLDIRNAFNSIGWTEVMAAIDALEVPVYLKRILGDYFQGRTAETQVGKNRVEVRVTCGVPQGSVVGPLLWNIAYDQVLRLQLPAGAKILGFADDTMILVSGATISELEQKANETLGVVSEEIRKIGLSLAVNKTEAVLFTNKYKFKTPAVMLDGHPLELKKHMKYLGMVVDHRLLFKEHTAEAAAKAGRTANQLARLMPNVGGPKQLRRRLYVAVMQSVLLYGAPSWSHTLDYTPVNVAQLNRVQRTSLLRSICAYRTVSETAANFLAAVPPADILARERSLVFCEKRAGETSGFHPRARTLAAWRARIAEASTGGWTKRLVQNIEAWCNRKHGELDFHLTQILSGHGCFGVYLHKIGKEESGKCHHCQAIADSAEHTLMECQAWEEDRGRLRYAIGEDIAMENLVPAMLRSPDVWQAVRDFARAVMVAKEEAERRRERAGRNAEE
jgi:hypothetical protein